MEIFINIILQFIFAAIIIIPLFADMVKAKKRRKSITESNESQSGDEIITYDDFVRIYNENWKYYKTVYTDYEKRILYVAVSFSIVTGFFVFFCMTKAMLNIKFIRWWTWVVPAICTILEFIRLGIYQARPEVKKSYAATRRMKHRQKMDFIRDSLGKIGIKYENKDNMKEFIDWCKSRRDNADLYVSERKYGTFVISAIIIPVLLAAFGKICGTNNFKNNPTAIVALTGLVIFFAFMVIIAVYSLFVSLIAPHINKNKKLYDDLVLDLENFYLFEVHYSDEEECK